MCVSVCVIIINFKLHKKQNRNNNNKKLSRKMWKNWKEKKAIIIYSFDGVFFLVKS